MKTIELNIENLIKHKIDPSVYIYTQLLWEGKHDLAEEFWNAKFLPDQKQIMTDYPVYFQRFHDHSYIRPAGINLFSAETYKTMDVSSWIEQYRSLFPVKHKGDRLSCVKKMEKFIKVRKFNKDLIIQATKLYLYERETEDPSHTFTQQAHYFIEKDQVSNLGSFCERIQSGDTIKETKIIGKKRI